MKNNDVIQNNSSKYTFWNLLKEYSIEIPIIQRDYAQGRTSDNATIIREELLDAIYQALTEQEPLEFDFVYGTVEGDILYPLDGQQRLTTFFLLHWYIAQKEQHMDEATKLLAKFSYTTRTSSRDFCKMLTQIDYRPERDVSVSEFIKDENGYFRAWDTDPTISHMLTMLDSIHDKFYDTEGLYENLTSEDCLLTFNYLPMEHYALTDELYIKMNARGKALSLFENFKAKFIQHLKQAELPYEHFEERIDKEWTDLLWDYRDDDNTIDKQFMNLFCFFTEMQYLESEEPQEGDSPYSTRKIRPLISYYDTEDVVDYLYKLFDLWKSKKQAVEFQEMILSTEREKGKVRIFDASSVDIFSAIINGEYVTLANKIILYSIMRRLIEVGEEDSLDSFRDYIRLVRNFLLNTRQFIRKKCTYTLDLRYGRHAIPIMRHYINELVLSDDPYQTLLDADFEGINMDILARERQKATLIKNKKKTKELIFALEDSLAFRTTIFNVIPYIEKHQGKIIVEDLEKIFLIYKGEKIIQALLSVEDYGIDIGSSTFGERYYYGQKDNWYSVLTYAGGEAYSATLCNFIDQYEATEADTVVARLDLVVQKNLRSIGKDEWRYAVVKYYNTVREWEGYIDGKAMVFALEPLQNGEMLAHRSNGFRLVGYHVVPEYLEAREQLGSLCQDGVRGFAGESRGCLHINVASGMDLSFNEECSITVKYKNDDKAIVEKAIDKYHETLESEEFDRVERLVLLARLLKEYSEIPEKNNSKRKRKTK